MNFVFIVAASHKIEKLNQNYEKQVIDVLEAPFAMFIASTS
jgi:hypothetical protein